ncbi:uncharacterized protein VP01_169g3 [Puccinia sorghi]|uniref:Uncharacterized protein n=1 Tax=Puccinia sorghi TaxID=27349 RepID=A0A0L6VFS1_9BASI|nr:uncharacterized protein VP01_169g3 [Puccinia sorghi]
MFVVEVADGLNEVKKRQYFCRDFCRPPFVVILPRAPLADIMDLLPRLPLPLVTLIHTLQAKSPYLFFTLTHITQKKMTCDKNFDPYDKCWCAADIKSFIYRINPQQKIPGKLKLDELRAIAMDLVVERNSQTNSFPTTSIRSTRNSFNFNSDFSTKSLNESYFSTQALTKTPKPSTKNSTSTNSTSTATSAQKSSTSKPTPTAGQPAPTTQQKIPGKLKLDELRAIAMDLVVECNSQTNSFPTTSIRSTHNSPTSAQKPSTKGTSAHKPSLKATSAQNPSIKETSAPKPSTNNSTSTNSTSTATSAQKASTSKPTPTAGQPAPKSLHALELTSGSTSCTSQKPSPHRESTSSKTSAAPKRLALLPTVSSSQSPLKRSKVNPPAPTTVPKTLPPGPYHVAQQAPPLVAHPLPRPPAAAHATMKVLAGKTVSTTSTRSAARPVAQANTQPPAASASHIACPDLALTRKRGASVHFKASVKSATKKKCTSVLPSPSEEAYDTQQLGGDYSLGEDNAKESNSSEDSAKFASSDGSEGSSLSDFSESSEASPSSQESEIQEAAVMTPTVISSNSSDVSPTSARASPKPQISTRTTDSNINPSSHDNHYNLHVARSTRRAHVSSSNQHPAQNPHNSHHQPSGRSSSVSTRIKHDHVSTHKNQQSQRLNTQRRSGGKGSIVQAPPQQPHTPGGSRTHQKNFHAPSVQDRNSQRTGPTVSTQAHAHHNGLDEERLHEYMPGYCQPTPSTQPAHPEATGGNSKIPSQPRRIVIPPNKPRMEPQQSFLGCSTNFTLPPMQPQPRNSYDTSALTACYSSEQLFQPLNPVHPPVKPPKQSIFSSTSQTSCSPAASTNMTTDGRPFSFTIPGIGTFTLVSDNNNAPQVPSTNHPGASDLPVEAPANPTSGASAAPEPQANINQMPQNPPPPLWLRLTDHQEKPSSPPPPPPPLPPPPPPKPKAKWIPLPLTDSTPPKEDESQPNEQPPEDLEDLIVSKDAVDSPSEWRVRLASIENSLKGIVHTHQPATLPQPPQANTQGSTSSGAQNTTQCSSFTIFQPIESSSRLGSSPPKPCSPMPADTHLTSLPLRQQCTATSQSCSSLFSTLPRAPPTTQLTSLSLFAPPLATHILSQSVSSLEKPGPTPTSSNTLFPSIPAKPIQLTNMPLPSHTHNLNLTSQPVNSTDTQLRDNHPQPFTFSVAPSSTTAPTSVLTNPRSLFPALDIKQESRIQHTVSLPARSPFTFLSLNDARSSKTHSGSSPDVVQDRESATKDACSSGSATSQPITSPTMTTPTTAAPTSPMAAASTPEKQQNVPHDPVKYFAALLASRSCSSEPTPSTTPLSRSHIYPRPPIWHLNKSKLSPQTLPTRHLNKSKPSPQTLLSRHLKKSKPSPQTLPTRHLKKSKPSPQTLPTPLHLSLDFLHPTPAAAHKPCTPAVNDLSHLSPSRDQGPITLQQIEQLYPSDSDAKESWTVPPLGLSTSSSPSRILENDFVKSPQMPPMTSQHGRSTTGSRISGPTIGRCSSIAVAKRTCKLLISCADSGLSPILPASYNASITSNYLFPPFFPLFCSFFLVCPVLFFLYIIVDLPIRVCYANLFYSATFLNHPPSPTNIFTDSHDALTQGLLRVLKL